MSSESEQATATAPGTKPALRTDPKSFVVLGLSSLRSAVFPIVAAYFAMRSTGAWALVGALAVGIAIIGFGGVIGYLRWKKFTYSVNAEDIRVDSGILSRTARSVPYERIQDVSLEQSLVPRLFGLVAVKFETGSGGGDDIALLFLREAEGERLRDLVRARKDGVAEKVDGSAGDQSVMPEQIDDSTALFAMDNKRLFTFGMFEFSLAVFAVVAGLSQYLDWFVDYEIWDADLWRGLVAEQQGWLAGLGYVGQAFGALLGVIGLLVVGSATGLVRTYLRDWQFKLEQSPRGFRRRRGLLTKTDVVMPAHRVQAIKIGTGILKYRFGWHSMNFVSLAQDSGSSNHTVVPFGKMEELLPVMRAANFAPPIESLDWHRASQRYRTDSVVLGSLFFLLLASPVAIWLHPALALIPLALAGVAAFANYYAWRFHRHSIDASQLFASRGLFAPRMQIASQVKLHSVEISQGPIAQRRGYATLHLGLAGGIFFVPGVPIERAYRLREDVIERIAQTDFSELHSV
jgi:putative membrane protein